MEVTQKEEKSGEVAAGKSGLQSDFGRTTPKNLHLPPHACKIKELKNDGTAPRAVAAVTFIVAVARSYPKIFPISRMVIVLLPPFVGWGYYPQSSMGEEGLEGMIRVFDRLLCPFWRIRCEHVSRRSELAETFECHIFLRLSSLHQCDDDVSITHFRPPFKTPVRILPLEDRMDGIKRGDLLHLQLLQRMALTYSLNHSRSQSTHPI